ncbi:MAG: PAS domain-containing protein [Nitrosomonadales bacterium]|nr:PAS domain-containing protein [Nitrosomonadales bacterium]
MSRKTSGPDQLCTKTEVQLALTPEQDGMPWPVEKFLHELQVPSAELEIQNEELRHALAELEKSRDCYMDLYDFAPVGYLTLTSEALIAEVNLTGATLLGIERKELLLRHFTHFIADDYSNHWNHFFLSVLQRDERQDCELVLQRSNGPLFSCPSGLLT